MHDDQIVDLYWKRDESAISHTQQKYHRYLFHIAFHVLADREDSQESVNDTYLKAWNSMPPHKPCVLSTYLGRITRQLAIDLFRHRNRQKRRPSQYALSLEELTECAASGHTPEEHLELALLGEAIARYLETLPSETRCLFVGRYYFLDSIKTAASYCSMSESKAKSLLHRTRIGLKSHLEKEGFHV